MQINLSRKLSDSSLVSHVSNDREEIDKYNNRPPIKKIPNLPEETEIELQLGEAGMDFVTAKKLPLSKDYKTSNFFTGFHHKAYVDNVQIAQNKSRSNNRSRSTSPALLPIPYTKKPPQNLSSPSKISRSPRHKSIRESPQTHNAENNIKHVFPNRALVSRSTSPINLQSVETNEPISTQEDVPKEDPCDEPQKNPKPSEYEEETSSAAQKEDPKRITSQDELPRSESEEKPTTKESSKRESDQIFHLDQLQDIPKPSENTIRDETVTPSKILRHFQFKHRETKGIPKDIPEKLLNRSQRSDFDQAFREIVESGKGPTFDDSQIRNEEFVKVGQRSRYSKAFQADVQRKNESPEIILPPDQNRSQGSKPADAFQEGVEDISNAIPKELFRSHQDSRCGKGYQENDHKEGDVSGTISKHSSHICRKCKYHKKCQKGDGDSEEVPRLQPRRFDDAAVVNVQQRLHLNENILDVIGSAKRMQLLDHGRGTRSADAFYKKVYKNSKSFNVRQRSFSDEIFQNEHNIPAKFDEYFLEQLHENEVDDTKDRKKITDKVPLNRKPSHRLNIPQEDSEMHRNHRTCCAIRSLQCRNVNHIKQCPNEMSQLLYYNYGTRMFKDGTNITSTISQGSLESRNMTSPIMTNTNRAIEEQTIMSNLLLEQDYDPEVPNQLQPHLQSETWSRYYQHTTADVVNNSNDILEAHHKVSSTSISFNSPKRPSSVPPLKRHQRKHQNPRDIEIDNHGVEEKSLKINRGKRTLIESIKNKVFPGFPCRVKEELKMWDETSNNGENLKFPKETKNAVMMMLSGAKSRASWKNDERYQASCGQPLTQIPAKTVCTKPSLMKNRGQLPCSKNLLCEKGFHSGKCRKSERAMMVKYSKHCICKERRFWCAECQNLWPGSAQRCAENSSEETEPEDAFLQLMEPQWAQKSPKVEKCMTRNSFNRQGLICNFRRKPNQ